MIGAYDRLPNLRNNAESTTLDFETVKVNWKFEYQFINRLTDFSILKCLLIADLQVAWRENLQGWHMPLFRFSARCFTGRHFNEGSEDPKNEESEFLALISLISFN